MRITSAESYYELRNSISEDWINYLNKLFQNNWMLIPVTNDNVVEYIKDNNITRFIISGGEDLGVNLVRDKSELEIIEYSNSMGMPLLGVCRGLQLIANYLGCNIIKNNADFISQHVNTNHEIIFNGNKYNVNSFHSNSIESKSMPQYIDVIAKTTTTREIEAISYKNMLGVMWHPERKNISQNFNDELILKHFI